LRRIKEKIVWIWQTVAVGNETPRRAKMVEKTETSGLWPSLYDPLRNFGHQVAGWLDLAAEASGDTAACDFSMKDSVLHVSVPKLTPKQTGTAQRLEISRI
jgi:hypothetical protein